MAKSKPRNEVENYLLSRRTRVQKTLNYLKTKMEDDYSKFQSVKFSPAWKNGEWLDGETYFYQFAVRNFYFHATAAYTILRNCGVEIGKGDFIGALAFKK